MLLLVLSLFFEQQAVSSLYNLPFALNSFALNAYALNAF